MTSVRIAAAGDVHADERVRPRIEEAFAGVATDVDLILLAGDLTRHGEPEEAQVVADACREIEAHVVCVLGNHDWHANKVPALRDVLEDAGVVVLDPAAATFSVNGTDVGVAGAKGFVGGFPGSTLPDFGEPLLREVYAETGREVDAIESGLQEIADCPLRIVLLHYSPTMSTLEGEPQSIWTLLGSNRLDGPIQKHKPDVVLHGHAHEGTFAGAVGGVPVYNVAVPVIRREFLIFELDSDAVTGARLAVPAL